MDMQALIAAATERVWESAKLNPYYDTIFADWDEGEGHFLWVLNAPESEIFDWVEDIEDFQEDYRRETEEQERDSEMERTIEKAKLALAIISGRKTELVPWEAELLGYGQSWVLPSSDELKERAEKIVLDMILDALD